jgi:hypothetical protein
MLNINSKGKQLLAAALPAVLASHFLLGRIKSFSVYRVIF